jgi:hypothetical protein
MGVKIDFKISSQSSIQAPGMAKQLFTDHPAQTSMAKQLQFFTDFHGKAIIH